MDSVLKRFNLESKHLDSRCPLNVRNRIAGELVGDWYLVGRTLNVSVSRLNSIRDNHTLPKPEVKAVAALDAWDEEKGSEATCLKLAQALHDHRKTATLEILCQEVNSKMTSEYATLSGPEPNTSTPVSLQPQSEPQRNQRRQEGHLTIKDLRALQVALWNGRSNWFNIGIQLKVSVSELEMIRKKHSNNPDECLTDLLTHWLRNATSPPTWSLIVKALRSHTVALSNLAIEIEKDKVETDDSSASLSTNTQTASVNEVAGGDISLQTMKEFQELTDKQKEDLEQRLTMETEDIKLRFHLLCNKFFNSLEAQQIPVKQLLRPLKGLKALKAVESPDNIIVDDIENVKDILEDYSSFFDFRPIEYMIELVGLNEDKIRLEKYKRDFEHYIKRRIFEGPSEIVPSYASKRSELRVKLESDYNKLVDLKQLQCRLSLILEVPVHVLQLSSFKEGCIELIFIIPNFVRESIFPLSAAQETALVEQGVMWLSCGVYHLDTYAHVQDQEREFLSKEGESTITESETERELGVYLSEREVMETRQELLRIELMGNVHRLLNQQVAAKIGRSLQVKIINGPLSKKLSNKLTKVPSKRGLVVGNHALNEVGSTSFEDSNKKELENLEELKVVKTRLADRRKASHLARRMFNQRVNNRRTNTSILLSGIEPDQEQEMETMRNMNRFVLDKFLQTQSQNRRVLERLNSKQVRTITDIEAGKAAKLRRRSDTSVHEAMILEEIEEKEKEERKKGIKRLYKHASISSFTDLTTLTGKTALQAPLSLQELTPSTYNAITPSGYQADSESHELSQENTGFPAPFPCRTEMAPFSEDLMQESPSKRAIIDDAESSLEDTDSCSFKALSILQPQLLLSSSPVKVKEKIEAFGVDYSFRSESKLFEDLNETSQTEVTVKQKDTSGHRVFKKETSDSEEAKVEVKEKEPTSKQETQSPSRLLASKKSSSLESKSCSEQNLPSSSSRMKRCFSSPYISTSNDLEPQMLPRLKPWSSMSRNRAYYSPVEIDEEFNPFNYEFENGDSSEVVSKGACIESDTMDFAGSQEIPSRSSSLCSPNQSPRVHARHPSAEAKEESTIPSSAYNNPRFLNYMQTLSHDPTYDDYITFQVVERIVVVGERIEKYYKDKIDFALDNIFMDIMKQTFSFESFRAVAGRLFFEAKRVQDRLFLVPLFARRLKEILKPEMRGHVNDYTEMFMDNVVTKYHMNKGGWENVIENYEDVEVYDHYNGDHEGGHLLEDGVDAPLYHQRGASNYDHLYDGTAEYQLPPTPYHPPLNAHNRYNVNRTQYLLETYERAEFQPTPAEEVRVLNEDRFQSYLALHHPYLFEPGYLRRVNSVDVLFQDKTAKFEDVLSSFPDPEDCYGYKRPTRKRSSQMSLARSLSLDSLASPGLTSGAFCMTPSASSTFLTRRISRSASRSPVPPVESPTKRVFPTRSLIHEHIDSSLPAPTNDKSITAVSNDPNEHSRTLPRPRPLNLPHPPVQHLPIDVPISQISVSLTTLLPSAVSQSSGDNYDSLYGPSRTNTGESADSANSKSNTSITKSENGSVSNSVHSRSQNGRNRNRNGKEPEGNLADTKKWVVPVVAVVTVSAVVLIAGYFYLNRKS